MSESNESLNPLDFDPYLRIAAVLGACRMSDFDDRDGVELPPKSAQSDDLRTRIAAVHDTYDPSRDGTRCVYGYWRRP